MSYHYPDDPHELGQNFLADPTVIGTIEALVARTTGPIVELGVGDGAVTVPLSRSDRNVTAGQWASLWHLNSATGSTSTEDRAGPLGRSRASDKGRLSTHQPMLQL